MSKKPDLVLVANASQARLLRREAHPASLVALATEQHPEGRLRAGELGGDAPGHGSADHRPGGVSFVPRIDPRRKEDLAFARALADRLEDLLAGGGYGGVLLFASAPFLGELKSRLGAQAQQALRATVDRDLTPYGLSELEQRIDAALAASR